ncbi:MAG: STAS domain-containing protein [Candidatus Omnitrophica bacterium]|nr:STAS domain-containing protein [Candidatus Omnitrophota bacterium]
MPPRFRESGNITILDIEGDVDINSSDIIESVGYLLNSGKTNFIFNLENVNVVDYSGLSVLTIAYKNVLNHKGKARFMNVPAQVTELFKMVKLENVFEAYPDEESAIRSFYEESAELAHLRRRFKRLDMNLNVVNMSAAGIFIFSKYTFPINSQLEIELIHRGDTRFLDATARVVWLADKELQPHLYPGMGVAFVHLSQENEKLIIDHIDKNITHRAES